MIKKPNRTTSAGASADSYKKAKVIFVRQHGSKHNVRHSTVNYDKRFYCLG